MLASSTNNIQIRICVLFFRDGVPYCERDYQIQFGVQCEKCQKFITGKVLEVGRVSLIEE